MSDFAPVDRSNRAAPNQDPSAEERAQQLSDTRERLTRLEAETHRLRAQLARLEAAGEDEAARKLEQQLEQLKAEQADPGGTTVVETHEFDQLAAERDAANDISKKSTTRVESDSGLFPSSSPGKTPTLNASQPAEQNESNFSTVDQQLPAALLQPTKTKQATQPAREVTELPELVTGEQEKEFRRPLMVQPRDVPAWATSLGVHAVLLLLFGLWFLPALQIDQPMLLGSAPDSEDEFFDEIVEVDLEPAELELSEVEPTELDPTELTEFEISDLDAPWDDAALGLADLAPGLASSLPTDAASLMLGESGGQKEGGRGRGERPGGGGSSSSAEFFGARSKGNRFVFVVDNSGSMKEGRMETTLIELQNAINAMSAEQKFYVIFYSDQAYPMFFPKSVDGMLEATRDNKRRLANWLATVEICLGGALLDAMKMAAELEPSVVYLLSDGDMGARTVSRISEEDAYEFPVLTFGMTVKKPEHEANLVSIAMGNGGAYTPVGIYPAAAQMARQRPLRYNRDGPGPVWGSEVRVRKR